VPADVAQRVALTDLAVKPIELLPERLDPLHCRTISPQQSLGLLDVVEATSQDRYRHVLVNLGLVVIDPCWVAASVVDGVQARRHPTPFVTETLIGLLRADPTSYLSVHPRFQPFLGANLKLGPIVNPNITGNRAYTRAHFLHYAGVVTPGTYR
jgi:hypothetical protein